MAAAVKTKKHTAQTTQVDIIADAKLGSYLKITALQNALVSILCLMS